MLSVISPKMNIFIILFTATLLFNYRVCSQHRISQNIGNCHWIGNENDQKTLVFICKKEPATPPMTLNINGNLTQCIDRNGRFSIIDKKSVGKMSFLSCNGIEIPNHLFRSFNNVPHFNVSHNDAEALQRDNFIGAYRLTILNVSYNRITEIPTNLFDDSKNLADVDFSHNQIKRFDANTFATENHVKYLNLSHNNITDFNVMTFHKLTELKQLDVSHNRIEEIPSFLFHKTDQLISVNFAFNKLCKIDDFAFAGDFSLKKLNLSHNQLAHLDKRIFDNHSNLTHFDVSSNQLTVLNAITFESLRNLLLLNLSNNTLATLSNKTFEHLVKLEHLILSQIGLSKVASGTFATLTNLQTLDLSSNVLKTLSADILPLKSTQLKLISIANNQLRELIKFSSSIIPNTKIVGIDSNQFNCTFLNDLFSLITWKHLDAISNRINCSSAMEYDAIGVNLTTIAVEMTTSIIEISIQQSQNDGILRASTENTDVIQTNGVHIVMKNEKIEHLDADTYAFASNYGSFKSIETHLFILLCIVTAGLVISAVLFIRLVSQTNKCEHGNKGKQANNIVNVRYSVESVKFDGLNNGVDNHAYEIIRFDKGSS